MGRPVSSIVGVAESALGTVSNETPLRMMASATLDALEEAGLKLADVDAIFTAGLPTWSPALEVADYLGLQPRHVNSSDVGGSSFEFHVAAADAAIAAGLCSVAVITYAATPRQDRAVPPLIREEPPYTVRNAFERPTGLFGPDIGPYALAADRYVHEFGVSATELAEVAVAARKWANLNPKAFRHGEPLSIDDVLNSPMVTDPLHTRDCCLITDGGGAVVMTSTDRAAKLRKQPIQVAGYGEAISHGSISLCRDLVLTGARVSSAAAYEMAGLGPADMDVVQIYDSFTITVLLSLENLGFCGPGEAGAFVQGGRIRPGGAFPLNTSGGGLSYCHPGRFGIFLLIEAVRQLRAECGERQVPGCRTALAHGTGGNFSSAATVLLTNEATGA
ncbi:MAG: thiolase [Acidimicrobiaceae bacterium]|nr:thiolase [Acidimicrobiaceae bacterium]